MYVSAAGQGNKYQPRVVIAGETWEPPTITRRYATITRRKQPNPRYQFLLWCWCHPGNLLPIYGCS